MKKHIKLKPNEKIKATVYRYGLTFFGYYFGSFAAMAMAFFLMFWFFQNGFWGTAGFVALISLSLLLSVVATTRWRRSYMIITTHRIIDIDSSKFLDKSISDVPYDQIEDVSGRVKGVMGHLFHYGDLKIQTGNGKVLIVVEKIKTPIYWQQKINTAREKYMLNFTSDFGSDLVEGIIEKVRELKLSELVRVKKFVKKRIDRLDRKG